MLLFIITLGWLHKTLFQLSFYMHFTQKFSSTSNHQNTINSNANNLEKASFTILNKKRGKKCICKRKYWCRLTVSLEKFTIIVYIKYATTFRYYLKIRWPYPWTLLSWSPLLIQSLPWWLLTITGTTCLHISGHCIYFSNGYSWQ